MAMIGDRHGPEGQLRGRRGAEQAKRFDPEVPQRAWYRLGATFCSPVIDPAAAVASAKSGIRAARRKGQLAARQLSEDKLIATMAENRKLRQLLEAWRAWHQGFGDQELVFLPVQRGRDARARALIDGLNTHMDQCMLLEEDIPMAATADYCASGGSQQAVHTRRNLAGHGALRSAPDIALLSNAQVRNARFHGCDPWMLLEGMAVDPPKIWNAGGVLLPAVAGDDKSEEEVFDKERGEGADESNTVPQDLGGLLPMDAARAMVDFLDAEISSLTTTVVDAMKEVRSHGICVGDGAKAAKDRIATLRAQRNALQARLLDGPVTAKEMKDLFM